jgi:hypothetical protein
MKVAGLDPEPATDHRYHVGSVADRALVQQRDARRRIDGHRACRGALHKPHIETHDNSVSSPSTCRGR